MSTFPLRSLTSNKNLVIARVRTWPSTGISNWFAAFSIHKSRVRGARSSPNPQRERSSRSISSRQDPVRIGGKRNQLAASVFVPSSGHDAPVSRSNVYGDGTRRPRSEISVLRAAILHFSEMFGSARSRPTQTLFIKTNPRFSPGRIRPHQRRRGRSRECALTSLRPFNASIAAFRNWRHQHASAPRPNARTAASPGPSRNRDSAHFHGVVTTSPLGSHFFAETSRQNI